MNIGIIGATGRVGSRILTEARQRNHEVTAIVRDKSRVADKTVAILVKDIFELQASDLAAFDVVVNAFGAPRGQEHLHMKVAEQLITLLKGNSKPKLFVVGGAGSLYVDDKQTLLYSLPVFPLEVKPTAQAQAEVLERIRQVNNFNWTFLSPSALFEPGQRKGKYRVGVDNLLVGEDGQSRISMEDYAVAVLDELEHPQHEQERFTVGY